MNILFFSGLQQTASIQAAPRGYKERLLVFTVNTGESQSVAACVTQTETRRTGFVWLRVGRSEGWRECDGGRRAVQQKRSQHKAHSLIKTAKYHLRRAANANFLSQSYANSTIKTQLVLCTPPPQQQSPMLFRVSFHPATVLLFPHPFLLWN